MRLALTLALYCTASAALAVGTEDDFTPPRPSETTETCEEGQIWDEETQACVAPDETGNDEATLKDTARELAYAGRHGDAAAVLDLLDPHDPWVLTYRGFLARKAGDLARATAYYAAALARDPDHLMARSYLGQGLVEAGDFAGARVQLAEIRQRDGRGTWPEVALRLALESGRGFSY